MGLVQRLLGLRLNLPPAGTTTPAVDAPVKDGTGREIERVRNGEVEVRGRSVAPGNHHAVTQKAGPTHSAVDLLRSQVAGEPVRPAPEFYADPAAFDAAYLGYQDQRMRQLSERYPDARYAGQLFHGTELPPEVVLKTGLPMKGQGDNFDLREHQHDFHQLGDPPESYSALRGACIAATTAGLFAGEGYYVYVLEPRGGGIELLAALRDNQVKGAQGEHEVCIGARQPACQIKAWYRVGAYSDVYEAHRLHGPYPNPDFAPVP